MMGEEVEDPPFVWFLYRSGQFDHWSPLEAPHAWLQLAGIIRAEEQEKKKIDEINATLRQQWNEKVVSA